MAISAYSLAAWSLCSYLFLLSGQRVWWLKLKCLRKGSINDDIDLEKGLHRRGSFNDMQCITGRLLRDTSLRYAFSALWFYACAIQHKKDFTMHHKTTLPTFWKGNKTWLVYRWIDSKDMLLSASGSCESEVLYCKRVVSVQWQHCRCEHATLNVVNQIIIMVTEIGSVP